MKLPPAALLPLSIAAVVAAVALTAAPCLGCFYYSEDFIQYWLAWLSLTSHPQLITQDFSMPWFQGSNMGLFYRPLVQLAYIADSLLYGERVACFHLTNLTCHVISSIICLLTTRQLLLNCSSGQPENAKAATAAGLVAGLLFGLNPLQLEPVYWLCCRCDGLCTMLSLTSFYLYLLSRSHENKSGGRSCVILLMILSVVAWLLALLAKEQAALMPIVILAHYLIYPPPSPVGEPADQTKAALLQGPGHSLKRRVYAGLRYISPYLIGLCFYSLIRLAVLGGIGGYHGTIGAILNETPFDRFTSPTAWSKLFYPMDQECFAALPWGPLLYSVIYVLMAFACLYAFKESALTSAKFRLVKFLAFSCLIVQVAAYQSFIITESLFGSRSLYMAQAFACMALAMLFTCFRPTALRNFLVPAFLALLAFTHVVNGSAWVRRGENLRAFQKAVNEWSAKNNNARKLCLLNVPLDTREVSSLYDLEQQRCLLKPPVNSLDNAGRVVQPSYLRMAPDVTNKTRVKQFLDDQRVDLVLSSVGLGKPFQLLDKSILQSHFAPIDQSVSWQPISKPKEAQADTGTAAFQPDLSKVVTPQRADIVEVTVAPRAKDEAAAVVTCGAAPETASKAASLTQPQAVYERALPLQRHPKGSQSLVFVWFTDLVQIEPYLNWRTAQFVDDEKIRTYVFPLADRTSWKYAGQVFRTVIANLPVRYKIIKIRLRDESSYVPTLNAVSSGPGGAADDIMADGFLPVNSQQTVNLNWDARQIPGTSGTMLQLSQPDFIYSLHSGSFREFDPENHSLKTIKGSSSSGTATLTRKDFPQVGKYQARLAAIDKAGQVIGFFSDPIDLIVSDRPFASALEKAFFNLRAQRQ